MYILYAHGFLARAWTSPADVFGNIGNNILNRGLECYKMFSVFFFYRSENSSFCVFFQQRKLFFHGNGWLKM